MRRAGAGIDRLYTAAIATFLSLLVLTAVLLAVRQCSYRPAVDGEVPFTPEANADAAAPEFDRSGTGVRSYNFLVLGKDRIAGLADTVIVVNVAEDGTIAAVQLPRDTYIETPDGNGGKKGIKLNGTLPSLGTEGMRSLIERTLCVKIDYTVTVSTEAFVKAVDAVGGVTVEVPPGMDYEDPEQDLYIHLEPGRRLLNGSEAEQFVRFRSGYADGDLGRLDAQKDFMLSMLESVRKKLNAGSAQALLEEVLPLTETDITMKDAIYFAGLVLRKSGRSGLTLLTAPGKPLNAGTSYYVLGRSGMLSAVNKYLTVAGTDIPDAVFDRERALVKDGDDGFERIYTYAIITPDPVSG